MRRDCPKPFAVLEVVLALESAMYVSRLDTLLNSVPTRNLLVEL